MSHTTDVFTDKTRQLKKKVYTSRIVSGFFAVGAAGSLALTAIEPTSLVAIGGVVASAAGAIVFGVRALDAKDRYLWHRRLHTMRRQTAIKLNKFPSESDFMLELASVRYDDSEPQPLHETGDAGDMQSEHMMDLYRTLERANARAGVMFAEVSSRIEEVASAQETYNAESSFWRIDQLLGRVHEGYHHLVKAQPYKKLFDFSSAALDQPSTQGDVAGMVRSIKNIAHELVSDRVITQEDRDRIYVTVSRLEPLLQNISAQPSVRQRAMLDLELVKLEVEIYAESYMLFRYKFEPSFIFNSRPV